MSEIKYVSGQRLAYYDAKLKAWVEAKDAEVLAASKKYFEDNAGRFDPSGTAQTKMEELANGAVKDNTDAINKLNGDASTEGSVAKAIADAKVLIDADIAAAKKAGDDAAEAVKAHEEYVGTFESEKAKTVIEYIDEKTSGIASDAALGELTDRVDAIEEDYLVEADKTELQGNIDGVSAKVTTLIGEDADKSVREIAGLVIAEALIPENAGEALDTLEEIAKWIQEHPADAAAMNTAITNLQNLVGTLPEGIDQTNVVDYVEALVAAEKARAEGIEAGLDARLKTVEDMFAGESEGTVAEQIADAKQEAIDAAGEAADAKVAALKATIENDYKAADEAITEAYEAADEALGARIEALEAIDHEHANKALLDTYTQTEENLADAVTKKHEHANKDVLDGITTDKVTAWDTAEADAIAAAKEYADGKDEAIAAAQKAGDDAMAAVEALEDGQVATNAADIEDHEGRIVALESVTHVEISENEINALFD